MVTGAFSPDGEVSDFELIDSIKNNVDVEDSLKELISRHSGIYYSMVKRFFPRATSKVNVDMELIFGSKDYVIYDSVLSYDRTRGTKFSTHVGNQTRFFCLNHINKAKPYSPVEPKEMEKTVAEEEVIHDKIDQTISSRIVEIIKDIPDKRVQEIFRRRYLDSQGKRATPWSKIYKHIPHGRIKNKSLTIQGCINLHNKALKEIRRKIKDIKDL